MMAVNMAILAFWEAALARAIFTVFLVSSVLMMGLYARFGYERILGLGHVLWIPLLAWVLLALPEATGAFRAYLLAWALTTAASLVLDIADVWRYLSRGSISQAASWVGSEASLPRPLAPTDHAPRAVMGEARTRWRIT